MTSGGLVSLEVSKFGHFVAQTLNPNLAHLSHQEGKSVAPRACHCILRDLLFLLLGHPAENEPPQEGEGDTYLLP